MSAIYESINKGFENRYGKLETGYNKKPKTMLEKTTPEDRANSNKLKELSRKAQLGYNKLTDEDEKFIDDMGFEVRSGGFIVPKGTPEDKVAKYSVKTRGWDYSPSQDATGLPRKLQRDVTGTTNPLHGQGRSSEEEKRLSSSLADAKRWGTDRSQKVLQTKLDKERQSLRDYRRTHSYQDVEREQDKERMSKNVKDFKDILRQLSPETEVEIYPGGEKYRTSNVAGRRADIEDRRAEARKRYADEMAYLDKRAQGIDEWEADLKKRKDALLRRNPKNESLLKEGSEDIPTYLSYIKRAINRIERNANKLSAEEANKIVKSLKAVLDTMDDLDI